MGLIERLDERIEKGIPGELELDDGEKLAIRIRPPTAENLYKVGGDPFLLYTESIGKEKELTPIQQLEIVRSMRTIIRHFYIVPELTAERVALLSAEEVATLMGPIMTMLPDPEEVARMRRFPGPEPGSG